MSGRSSIAIDIGRRRLCALEASGDHDRLKVRRVLVSPLAEGLGADDPRALGAWVGRVLAEGRFNRGRVTVAVSREHVVLKRLTLPTGDARELPEMTRLALQRDLPFNPQAAVIDYVCMERRSASTTVLAVAVPESVLSGIRQAARGAGLGVERISLRSMGTAALLGDAPDPILAVDISGERFEFSVVSGGVVRFSRAGELPQEAEPRLIAEAVITEARRTWMSYRILEESRDVGRVVVMGRRAVAELVARSIGDLLKVDAAVLGEHPAVDCREDLGEAWPLAGLLLASPAAESIDFAHPSRAPDTASRRRQVLLGVAGVAVIGCLAAGTMARLNLSDLDRTADRLDEARRREYPEYLRYGRDLYKLRHLQQWETVQPDWLSHLDRIAGMAPPPDRLVLGQWIGTLSFKGVKFDRPSKAFTVPGELGIVVEGEAADRQAADAFRGTLVDGKAYDISTAGPDTQSGRRLPYSFQYNLRTGRMSPGGTESEGDGGGSRGGSRGGAEGGG